MTKKEIVFFIACIIVIASLITIGLDRMERINNGEMVLVNHNEADR